MATAAVVICVYLVVTAIVTFLLFLMDKAAAKESAGTAYGENYYELKDYHYRSPCWEERGHIGEGCVKLMFLPFYWIFQSVSKLHYAITNLAYYLPGGIEKRASYIKNYVEKLSVKLREHENLLGEPDPVVWLKEGNSREWNLKEIMDSGCYKQFAEDYLMTPRVFWKKSIMSFLTLLFWPVTIFFGYGSLGLLLCTSVMSYMFGWPKLSEGSFLNRFFGKVLGK